MGEHGPTTGTRSARPGRYADAVAAKKRSGKSKKPRHGISGNPQRRAEQLAERQAAITDEPDLSPLVMDFRSGKPENSAMREMAYALAGGAKPAPWWSASHERVLASARALDWPARTLDVEAQACRIVAMNSTRC